MTTLRLRADRTLIRSRGSSVRYLLASITAPAAPLRTHRMPVNIALVLDRSGSMQDDGKFPLAVTAVEHALRQFQEDDRFSFVVFDDHVDVVTPSTLATPDAKRQALRALSQLEPRASTDLCSGWMHGCEQVSPFIEEGTITRVLLLTDGQANHGETNHDVLVHHAAELHRRGIRTSCIGLGGDFDERLLGDITRQGGGNNYWARTPQDIKEFVTSELGEAREVVMPQASLAVHLPRGAEATVLNDMNFRKSHERTAITVDLGDLASLQELNVVIRVKFPLGDVDDVVRVRAELDGRSQEVAFTYASHLANDEQPRDRAVDREVAQLYAARARAEATEANRAGDYDRARRVLVGTSRHILEYAGEDRMLTDLAMALRDQVRQYAEAPMSAMELKASYYVAHSAARGRTFSGKARRGGAN